MSGKAVTVYSTPTCPWCRKVKDYLKGRGIEFTDVNVAEDRAKLEEMIELTGQRSVPVIKVDGQIIVGFSESKLEKALSD